MSRPLSIGLFEPLMGALPGYLSIAWFEKVKKPMSSNETTEPRQHAFSGPASPQLPEPSHAERIRTLISLTSVGTLSTLSRKHPGFPFGSLMPFALDPGGQPLFLISNMAMHTQNLKADPRCSLFVGQAIADSDPLGTARATLIGRAESVPASELHSVREAYLARHENSRYWVDFSDFSFFRLQPVDLYYVGGFGVMGWVEAREYQVAAPDPLAAAAPGILAHMNSDHVDAMTGLPGSAYQMTRARLTVKRIFRDVASDAVDSRKGLAKAIEYVREGDTLFV